MAAVVSLTVNPRRIVKWWMSTYPSDMLSQLLAKALSRYSMSSGDNTICLRFSIRSTLKLVPGDGHKLFNAGFSQVHLLLQANLTVAIALGLQVQLEVFRRDQSGRLQNLTAGDEAVGGLIDIAAYFELIGLGRGIRRNIGAVHHFKFLSFTENKALREHFLSEKEAPILGMLRVKAARNQLKREDIKYFVDCTWEHADEVYHFLEEEKNTILKIFEIFPSEDVDF